MLWLAQGANWRLSRTYLCVCFVMFGVFLPKPLTPWRCKIITLTVVLRKVQTTQETWEPTRTYVVQGLSDFFLICKAEIPQRKPAMQLPTDWVCHRTLSKWTNSIRAVERHCQARQVRGGGQPWEHQPDPTSPCSIVDRQFPMDGTT